MSKSSLLKSGRKMWRGEQEQGRLPGRTAIIQHTLFFHVTAIQYEKREVQSCCYYYYYYSYSYSVKLRGTPLYSEMGWTQKLWSNCIFLILEN